MAFNVKSLRRSERVLYANRSFKRPLDRAGGRREAPKRARSPGSCVRDFGYWGVEEWGSAVSILMSAVMAFETSFMLATGIRSSFPCPSEA